MNSSFLKNKQLLFSTHPTMLLIGIVLLSLFVSSCKNQQPITLNNGKCFIDPKSAKVLTKQLKEKEFKFDRLNAKISAEALIDSSSNSFTITLRLKKDSVLWMSISKIGIEGARVLITKDSVKFLNRIKNQFFIGDYAFISKLLNTDLDFEMLQSLLVGNSVEFYDEDEKIKSGVDNCQYTLGTIRKHKLKKVMEKGKELKEPAQSIYMQPDNFKIVRILFYEFNPDRSFDAQFSDFTKVDSTQQFPQKIKYTIVAKKNVLIDINYTKIVLNEEQSFPFKIPDNYEQVVYKEQ